MGKYAWADGNVYEGGLVAGVFMGKGKYTRADGEWFEAEFDNNAVKGEVTIHRPDGTTYTTVLELAEEPE
jgi:hypothetical protein